MSTEEAIGKILADQFFSDQEKRELADIQELRFKLIKRLTTDEQGGLKIPGATSEKLLLTDLMNNADKSNRDRAKLRISSKAADAAGIDPRDIAEVLKRHRVTTMTPAEDHERKLPEGIKPQNVVPGEMSIGVENISIHEIL